MKFRHLIARTLILWVVFELGAAAQVRGPSGATLLTGWLRAIVEPPVAGTLSAIQAVTDFAHGFSDARSLARTNHHLILERDRLKSRIAALQTDLEASREAAAGLAGLPMFTGYPGRCLYRDLGRGYLLATVTSNAAAVIHHDTAVLGAGGVVGRVFRLEGRDCWVESLTHAAAAVAVTTRDDSIRGLCEGSGGPNLDVRFVPHRAPLTVGQTLLTSGSDGIYPPGLPVATVTTVREGGGPFLEVTATPLADPMTVRVLWFVTLDDAGDKHDESSNDQNE